MSIALTGADQSDWPALQGPHNAAECRRRNRRPPLGSGSSRGMIELGLRTYPGLPHRMERVREKDGVLFVNDSKATNPTATAPALAAFERIRWICGGLAKTDNLDECAPHFGHVAHGLHDRRGGRIVRAALVAAHGRGRRAKRWTRRCARPRRMRKPGIRCCCRRPARASTSSATSKSAATSSGSWWGRYDQEHLRPDQGQGGADRPGAATAAPTRARSAAGSGRSTRSCCC